MIFNIQGCGFILNNPEKYFANSRIGLLELKEMLLEKENVGTVYRRGFLSPLRKMLGWQTINYRIDNKSGTLHISFELKHNIDYESSELNKKILHNDVTSDILFRNKDIIQRKNITFDSALSYFQLSKDKVISIFEKMKEYKIIAINRLNQDHSTLAFLIDDRYYIIYTTNIRTLTLERKKSPQKLDENWYYYDGVL